MKRDMLWPSVSLSIIAGLASLAVAQSGTRGNAPSSRSRVQGGTTRAQRPFVDKLWTHLERARYGNWAPMPGQSAGMYAGQSPHGARLKLYANRTAAGRPTDLPNGSVLVKENYNEDGTELMAITVMYRSQGFAPDSGDWYWVKYEPTGIVSVQDGRPVAGRVNMCIDCHEGAGGNDFVFAND